MNIYELEESDGDDALQPSAPIPLNKFDAAGRTYYVCVGAPNDNWRRNPRPLAAIAADARQKLRDSATVRDLCVSLKTIL